MFSKQGIRLEKVMLYLYHSSVEGGRRLPIPPLCQSVGRQVRASWAPSRIGALLMMMGPSARQSPVSGPACSGGWGATCGAMVCIPEICTQSILLYSRRTVGLTLQDQISLQTVYLSSSSIYGSVYRDLYHPFPLMH